VTSTSAGRALLFLRGRKSERNAGAAYLFQIHMAMKSQLSKTFGEVSSLEKKGRCCILSLYLEGSTKKRNHFMPQCLKRDT